MSGESKIWVFPTIGVPQNGWFVMEKPIKMDDGGEVITLFFGNTHMPREKNLGRGPNCNSSSTRLNLKTP